MLGRKDASLIWTTESRLAVLVSCLLRTLTSPAPAMQRGFAEIACKPLNSDDEKALTSPMGGLAMIGFGRRRAGICVLSCVSLRTSFTRYSRS